MVVSLESVVGTRNNLSGSGHIGVFGGVTHVVPGYFANQGRGAVYKLGSGEQFMERYSSGEAYMRMMSETDRKNILFYVDETALVAPTDSSRYLGQVFAQEENADVYFSTIKDETLARNADVVAMRIDPPLDHGFSYRLEEYDDGDRVFLARPSAQRFLSDKHYMLDMMNLGVLPSTMISRNVRDIENYAREIGDEYVIMKPVRDSFGGDGVERVRPNDVGALAYVMTNGGTQDVICQKYIDNIAELGDKRIYLLDGEPIGAVLRKPQEGSFLSNVKKGGSVVAADVDDDNMRVIEALRPMIAERGMRVVGIDVIGPYLGEVNGVSPGLLRAIDDKRGLLYDKRGAAGQIASWALEQTL